jgi:uncharacterized membrane protein YeaQ/YmgE (transglycosylase-associated protein family)
VRYDAPQVVGYPPLISRKEPVVHLIFQLIIGGIIGWLASIVMKTNAQMGLLANIIVGCVGAFIGRWIATQLNMAGAGVMGWVISILGAVIFIWVLKLIGIFK